MVLISLASSLDYLTWPGPNGFKQNAVKPKKINHLPGIYWITFSPHSYVLL